MPELHFTVEGVEPLSHAAAPALAVRLHVHNRGDEAIHGALIRCQVNIEAGKRRYAPDEQAALRDLFGQAHLWDRSVRTLLWSQVTLSLPAFAGETQTALHLPCSYDFNAATGKYFQALADDAVPICLLFSGTVFYAHIDAPVQAMPVPWSTETRFNLPVSVWQATMHMYYPHQTFVPMNRDTYQRLCRYTSRQGLTSWEQALNNLLTAGEGSLP